uniref:Uncharacterized protein n=1 Tax=Rhizophagus irregularis (strain DAOM 181602 / DAOM 197198 / MUCL 43194) TaxID=747089 RepID=U9SKM5_RHIID
MYIKCCDIGSTLQGVLDNLLKEDLSNEEVQDSKVLDIQLRWPDNKNRST